MAYLVLKSVHIIAVISWMAGIFYLPRLYVYHADSVLGSEQSDTFKIMERRLLRAIMNPAMLVTWITGLIIAVQGSWHSQPWFIAKFVLVLGMSGFHAFLSVVRKDFEADKNQRSSRQFRILNEIPTLLLIGIVFLVILKPF